MFATYLSCLDGSLTSALGACLVAVGLNHDLVAINLHGVSVEFALEPPRLPHHLLVVVGLALARMGFRYVAAEGRAVREPLQADLAFERKTALRPLLALIARIGVAAPNQAIDQGSFGYGGDWRLRRYSDSLRRPQPWRSL